MPIYILVYKFIGILNTTTTTTEGIKYVDVLKTKIL